MDKLTGAPGLDRAGGLPRYRSMPGRPAVAVKGRQGLSAIVVPNAGRHAFSGSDLPPFHPLRRLARAELWRSYRQSRHADYRKRL